MKILLRNSIAFLLIFTMVFTLGVSSFSEDISFQDGPLEIFSGDDKTVAEDVYGEEDIGIGGGGTVGDIDIIGGGGGGSTVTGDVYGGLEYTVRYFIDSIEATELEFTSQVPIEEPIVEDIPYYDLLEKGYVLDELKSTELPFMVTEEDNVIMVFYIPAAKGNLEYIMNYHYIDLEGEEVVGVINDEVKVDDPILTISNIPVPEELPEGYVVDEELSTLPFEVKEENIEADNNNNVIDVYYLPLAKEEEDQGVEYFPQVDEPPIELPQDYARNFSRMMLTSTGLQDTIEVNKEAKRILGLCRTYQVTLSITGTPQQAPVDVVLVIDRSGSMNETTGSSYGYYPITEAPANNETYYVKVGGEYKTVTRVNLGSIRNPNYKWRYSQGSNYYYVNWELNGDDNGPGSTNSNNPANKSFYAGGNTRLYHAKQAAVNFAYKVLGPGGIPGSRVSIVSFAGPTSINGYGTQDQAKNDIGLTTNLQDILVAINGISATGGTNTEAGFLAGKEAIEHPSNPTSNKVVIMFTDGLPTASNGNKYAVTTSASHVHVTRAKTAGQSIFPVASLYTIGLLQNMTTSERTLALNILNATQNKGFYEAPTAGDLDQIFNDIATQLGYAATNAVVTDVIGDNFNLVENSLPAGATYNSSTRTITWNAGTIYESSELKFNVQAKPEFAGGRADTNKSATLKYTDIFGATNRTKTFPVPNVNVPTKLSVSLADANIALGQSIYLGAGTDQSGENYMSPISGGDGDGSYTYEWRIVGETDNFSSDKNPSVSPEEDTEYELTVIDSNGCRGKATMWVRVGKGKVTITKVVTGNFAELGREFDFTATINDESPIEFSLSNGQSKILEDIPKGAVLTLSEVSDGYIVTVKVGEDVVDITNSPYTMIFDGQDITILVTNHKDVDIPTGITFDTLPYIIILSLATIGLGTTVVRKRNIRKED